MRELLSFLREKGLNEIVFSDYLSKTDIRSYAEKIGFHTYGILDSRSAGYFATGLSVEANSPVILIVESNNDSRNCYSALTEAHYRKIPIIFITIETDVSLDYKNEIKDTVAKTATLYSHDIIDDALLSCVFKNKAPIHIIFRECVVPDVPKINITPLISKLYRDSVYIFLDRWFSCDEDYMVKQSVSGGYDGVVSSILGASLSNRFEKYIGVASINSLLHDIDALGNKCVNDGMSFVIIGEHEMAGKYAYDMGYDVYYGMKFINKALEKKKSVIFLKGLEDEH